MEVFLEPNACATDHIENVHNHHYFASLAEAFLDLLEHDVARQKRDAINFCVSDSPELVYARMFWVLLKNPLAPGDCGESLKTRALDRLGKVKP